MVVMPASSVRATSKRCASVIEKAQSLVSKWREEARVGRELLMNVPEQGYLAAVATILRAERDANELDALLSALIAEAPPQQEVVEMTAAKFREVYARAEAAPQPRHDFSGPCPITQQHCDDRACQIDGCKRLAAAPRSAPEKGTENVD